MITEADIKVLKSARMADTPDGGGRMSPEVLVSGQDNNMFDDVSALSRVYGEVSLRKVFPAIVTPTKDKYLGARVIIDKPPADPNIHGLLFAASSLFDVRAAAQSRLESYLTEGPNASLLLYGPHITGTSNIALIKQVNNQPPAEGDVYVLKKEGATQSQFVRITAVSVVRTDFSDSAGDFTRDVVTLTISDPLRFDFPGWQATRYDTDLDFTGRTRVLTTVVADAAQYFGIRPLAVAATQGQFVVKADSAFSNLLPSAQIESPIALAIPYSAARLPAAGVSPVTYTDNNTWSPTIDLVLPGGVRPGTLSIATGGLTVTDQGGILLAGPDEVGTIDYSGGVAHLNTTTLGGAKVVTFQPAAYVDRAPQSTEVEVTESGRRLNYTGVIAPIPQSGTMSVSFMAQGRWYTLTDAGGGLLRGLDGGYGGGTVNLDTGSFLVTLGALPDVGSSLIFSWGVATQETPQPPENLKASQKITLAPVGGSSVQPNSLVVTWNNGTLKTATAAADGTLSGDATGTISVSSGEVVFAPNNLPPLGTELTLAYTEGAKHEDAFAHPSRDGTGRVNIVATLGSIKPGSLEVEWNTITDLTVLGTYTEDQLTAMGISFDRWVDPIHIARDDGNGFLRVDGATVGTVNYSTGAISVLPDLTIKIPRPSYSSRRLTTAAFRLNYTGLTYVSTPTVYPPDESGSFKLRYNSAGATNNRTEVIQFAPVFKIVPGVNSPVLPGSVLVVPVGSSGLWSDSSTGTLRERSGNSWLTRGTINYLTGDITLTGWLPNQANTLVRWNAITTLGENISSEFVFRTATAPLRPGSVSIQFARASGGTQNLTVPITGIISAPGVSGKVDHETGIVRLRFGAKVVAVGNESQPWYFADNVDVDGNIFKPAPVATSTVKYSATAYAYLPLDSTILGLDPVRLPTDGRVPVFKKGRVIVIHHTTELAPRSVTNGATVDTGRTRLARLRVFGADGLEIKSGFTLGLDAGTVTFTNVSGYSQPVVIEHRIEDEALCAEAQITGELRLTRPLTHNFPIGSYVSSAFVQGTLQAATQEAFSQESWTNVWKDERIGVAILPKYNDTLNPIVVTNAGAIPERWACIFQNNTTYQLVGENSGQIIVGTTNADLAPVNPATGVPYFTLTSGGWGTGWVAGNVMRFNTSGPNFPLWISRTVMQSPAAPPGTDQLTISIRGDIDQ